jgi:hypothetical protein
MANIMEKDKNKKTYIYGLMDGDVVKYVGKSDNPNQRKYNHISEALNSDSKTHRINWIKKMVKENKEISLKILEIVPYDKWEEKEKYWIEYYGLDNLDVNGISNRKYSEELNRTKNLKITPKTHELLKKYCEENGLKMFAFVEKLIKEACTPKKDIYGE